jgi:putative DNA primase/helicase
LWIDTNYVPIANNRDDAIWARMKLIPFKVQIPRSQQDLFLYDKLLLELPSILEWAIQGCLLWQEEGLEDISQISSTTEEHRMEQDSVGQFLLDEYIYEDDEIVSKIELRTAYESWCDDNGIIPVVSMGAKSTWGKELKNHGLKDWNEKGKKYWKGIKKRQY